LINKKHPPNGGLAKEEEQISIYLHSTNLTEDISYTPHVHAVEAQTKRSIEQAQK